MKKLMIISLIILICAFCTSGYSQKQKKERFISKKDSLYKNLEKAEKNLKYQTNMIDSLIKAKKK